jgi:hypothetical protein
MMMIQEFITQLWIGLISELHMFLFYFDGSPVCVGLLLLGVPVTLGVAVQRWIRRREALAALDAQMQVRAQIAYEVAMNGQRRGGFGLGWLLLPLGLLIFVAIMITVLFQLG